MKKILIALSLSLSFFASKSQTLQFTDFGSGQHTYFTVRNNGQLYYMPDFGATPGKWVPIGEKIKGAPGETYSFAYISYGNNQHQYFAMGSSGQLYYMADYEKDNGKWKTVSEKIKAAPGETFSFQLINYGNSQLQYFALSSTGTLYFMPTYGATAGKWGNFNSKFPD